MFWPIWSIQKGQQSGDFRVDDKCSLPNPNADKSQVENYLNKRDTFYINA